jgi:hypothetical protein
MAMSRLANKAPELMGVLEQTDVQEVKDQVVGVSIRWRFIERCDWN